MSIAQLTHSLVAGVHDRGIPHGSESNRSWDMHRICESGRDLDCSGDAHFI
jgi:hypothetical protein